MKRKFFHCFLLAFLAANILPASAQSDTGSPIKDFLKSLLFCGPGDRMCDENYNPNVKNAMIESPDQVIKFFTQIDSYMSGRRDSVIKQSRPVSADAPPISSPQPKSLEASKTNSTTIVWPSERG
jgi:hypothetical protein